MTGAVEVRGIHHRANHSFCAKGRFCRIFGRNLRKFKEKLKSEGCRTRTGLGSNSKVEIGSGPVNLTSHSVHPRSLLKLGPNGGGIRRKIR
ncbi:RNA-dependent RNA polymerase family protein [Prunus dulcis]|uniref:RNA-dependent RNA polymerase family protein n=1 Tax=Prunus dulcis TaxID=3755 RepID=A0A4Y1RF18_PRUDU|nr:RNA-dependent RNA polymerase family protein [Prunus dulcis]